MAKTFTLELVNPAVTSGPTNVIKTGLTDGNDLTLVLTNHFGFPLTFGGSANKGLLLVKISKSIINDKNIALITVASPWTLEGFYTPANDPDEKDNKNYYVLKLKPPAAGVPFKDGSSVSIELKKLNPTQKGGATVFAEFDFGSGVGVMNPSSQLAVIGSDKPDGKPLIGDADALRFTLKVNSGGDTNPIIVTESPVTKDNAAENKMHLNFDFQDHNMPPNKIDLPTLGHLVSGWDKQCPPTFRIEFPYFDADSKYPAPLDLTDDFRETNSNYNEYTSAWNIKLSLDSDNPDILSNTWWVITPPNPLLPTPFWLIQPTPANKYVFTGINSGDTGSGRFLDLFFSHIYSSLPISGSHPETFMYLETYNFPGFNDNASEQTLFKEQSVQITDFAGEVKFTGGVAELLLYWETKNAINCLVSGDSDGNQPPNRYKKSPQHKGNPYHKVIKFGTPLTSSYTLTAVGKHGVSKIEKTLDLQWKLSSNSHHSVINNPTGIDVSSPRGEKVYVAANTDDSDAAQLVIFGTEPLVNANEPITLPDTQSVLNVKASGDGTSLILAGFPASGDNGYLYGYTTAANPQQLPGSPAESGFNSSINLYPMAISDDSTQVFVSAPYTSEAEPFIAGYDINNDFKPSKGSPYNKTGKNPIGPIGLATYGKYIFYPTSNGLGVLDRTTFQPLPNSPISLKSDDNISYTPGPLVVSPDGSSVMTLAQGYLNSKRVFILCSVDIESMTLNKRVQVYTGYGNAYPSPTTAMAYSIDGTYLFVFGVNFCKKQPEENPETLFSVFDSTSLQELSWSPIPVTEFFVDMVMAPDGSRIYVATLDSAESTVGKVLELIPYFE